MKYTNLKPLFIITLLFYAFVASAQSGAVYSFLFNVNPELTDFVKVERNNKKWFSEYSSGDSYHQSTPPHSLPIAPLSPLYGARIVHCGTHVHSHISHCFGHWCYLSVECV